MESTQGPNPEIERKPVRIIYIEDIKEFRNFVEEEFKEFPADVKLIKSFFSTEEAKDYLVELRREKQQLPDGIISDNDLGLGKATGVQFARDLKQQGFNIPVVLFTGDAEVFKSLSVQTLNAMGIARVVNKLESIGSLVTNLNKLRFPNSPQNNPQ